MSEAVVAEYLETVRADAYHTARALADAVAAVDAGFDCKVTWKMLVYAFDARWRDWVVAIGVSKSVVNLRFLHGDQLDDPAGLLRAGSSTMMTIDYAVVGDVDGDLVTAYVREAAQKHPHG